MSVDFMIRRFASVWGNPKTEEPELFLAEYRRSLSNFSDEVLQKAADKAIDSAKFWPKPAEIRELAVASERHANGLRGKGYASDYTPAPTRAPLTESQRRTAEAIMKDFRRTSAALDLNEIIKRPPPLDREAFKEMQEMSPNRGLHQEYGLTAKSRAMSGDVG